MAKLDQTKINGAIHVGLERCYEKPQHLLPAIEEFLDNLRATGSWYEVELHVVERGIRQVLACGVLNGSSVAPRTLRLPGSKARNLTGA